MTYHDLYVFAPAILFLLVCWFVTEWLAWTRSHRAEATVDRTGWSSFSEPPPSGSASAALSSSAASQRLDRLPWTPFHTRLLLKLGASWAVIGFQVSLDLIFRVSQVQIKDLGSALTFYLLATAFGAVAFGRLADLLGRRFIYAAGFALCALGATLTSLSGNEWTLALFRFVTGLGVGAGYVATNTLMQEFAPARVRGWACLAVNASFWLGSAAVALGLALSLFQSPGDPSSPAGWRVAAGIGAALCLIVLFFRRSIPESPRWLLTHSRVLEAERIVEEVERSLPPGTVLDPVSEFVQLNPRPVRQTVREVWRIMWHRERGPTLLCFALMALQSFFYNALFFGYDRLLSDSVDASLIGWHMLAIALGNFSGPVVLGFLTDRKDGRRRTMAGTFLASGVLLTLTAVLFASWRANNFDPAYVTVAWTVIFFFASTAASSAYLTTGETFPTQIRGLAFGLVLAASMLAGVLGRFVFVWDVNFAQLFAAEALVIAAIMVMVAFAVAPVTAVAPVPREGDSIPDPARQSPVRSGDFARSNGAERRRRRPRSFLRLASFLRIPDWLLPDRSGKAVEDMVMV